MSQFDRLRDGNLSLRPLSASDASVEYVGWLNDPAVNRFLETRHSTQTLESCRQFIESTNEDPCAHLFGIFLGDDGGRHVGNAKLGFVSDNHQTAQLSLFLGDRETWGRGIGMRVVRLLTRYGFESLDLAKIEAGCYEENLGSLKAFLRAGYVVEGFFRSHVSLEGRRQGCFWLGVTPGDTK